MVDLPNCFYRVSVKALILNEARDKFLICRESDGFWELPGGGLDWGATPNEDLRREIQEEMGLNLTWIAENPSYFFTGQQTRDPSIKIANVVYEAKLEHLNFTPSDECLEIKFVDRNDVLDLKVYDGVSRLSEAFNPKNHMIYDNK